MLRTGQSDVLHNNAKAAKLHNNAMKLKQNAQRFTSRIKSSQGVTETHNEFTENVNTQKKLSIKSSGRTSAFSFYTLPIPIRRDIIPQISKDHTHRENPVHLRENRNRVARVESAYWQRNSNFSTMYSGSVGTLWLISERSAATQSMTRLELHYKAKLTPNK